MKTPCCAEDESCTQKSRTRILRSACHGHSHDIHERKPATLRHRKAAEHLTSERLVDSSAHNIVSSLKHLVLKSSKTFSVLKQHLQSHVKISTTETCELTSLNDSHQKKDSNIISIGCCAHGAHGLSSITHNLESSSPEMSRTKRLPRNSIRALSDSEGEETTPKELVHSGRSSLRRKNISEVLSTSSSNQEESISKSSSNHGHSHKTNGSFIKTFSPCTNFYSGVSVNNQSNHSKNNHNQRYFFHDSSKIDISAVQCSSFDKFRWLLWRYIYLKIITLVNFDVWLLSRLRVHKVIFFLLLIPLLIYLFYGLFTESEDLSEAFNIVSSSVVSIPSFLYSLLPFTSSQGSLHKDTSHGTYSNLHTFTSSFSQIPGMLFGLFSSSKKDQGTSKDTIRDIHHASDNIHIRSQETMSKDDIKSFALEVLDDKLNDLMRKIEILQGQENYNRQSDAESFQKEINDIRKQLQTNSEITQKQLVQLQTEIDQTEKYPSRDDLHKLRAEQNTYLNSMNGKLKSLEEKISLLNSVKDCCKDKLSTTEFIESIEKYFITAFKNVVAAEESSASPYLFFNEWLSSKFVDHKTMSSQMSSAIQKVEESHKSKVDGTSSRTYDRGSTSTLTYQDVQKLIKEAIMLYDADKTGMVDYALESGGGSILGTRCSESYDEKNGKFSIFRLPLWSYHNSPRTAIQPDVQPGKCWAFKGSQGFLVIQLSYTIHPTGFTLEHIPVYLSPAGSIDSAPKNFSVWGLSSEIDNEGTLLGRYSYDQNGKPLQYFPVQNSTTESFSFVELKIQSNHGNLDYTCLYRFRVHGTRV